MPVDVMGDPQAIQAFRQRQEARPPEVPTNIERQNARSVQRSAEAASDASPAGSTQVPESVRDVISSPGQSLDASIQRAMEDRMGDSLGDVRIHTGANAAAACESIDARAFTVGSHVAFNSGEYDPSSPEGQHVLAHELAHVRQQTGGAVSMLPQEDVELEVDPDPALEREAEETAQRVMQGGELGIQCMRQTSVHVQRMMDSSVGPIRSGSSGGPSQSAVDKYDLQDQADDGPSIELESDGIDEISANIEELAQNQQRLVGDVKLLRDHIDSQANVSSIEEAAVEGGSALANVLVPGSGILMKIAHKVSKMIRSGDVSTDKDRQPEVTGVDEGRSRDTDTLTGSNDTGHHGG